MKSTKLWVCETKWLWNCWKCGQVNHLRIHKQKDAKGELGHAVFHPFKGVYWGHLDKNGKMIVSCCDCGRKRRIHMPFDLQYEPREIWLRQQELSAKKVAKKIAENKARVLLEKKKSKKKRRNK